MTDDPPNGRREGDDRPFIRAPFTKLNLWPVRGQFFRWKSSQGEPGCVGEYVTQFVWSHRILIYIAIVVTLILVVQLFDVNLMGVE